MEKKPYSAEIRKTLTQINQSLQQLEARVSRLEAAYREKPVTEEPGILPLIPQNMGEVVDNLEFRIGQYWLAKSGIVILAIGITFLLTLPYKNFPAFLPSILGFSIVGILFLSSHLLRKSVEFLSRYLLGGGLILLYFSTLRFHFFTETPVIGKYPLFIFLLTLNVALCFLIAIRRTSPYLTGIAITLGFITALVGNQPLFIFLMLTILSSLAVYLKIKNRWSGILLYTTVGVYFTHLGWFINNPLLGNSLQLLSSPRFNILFVLGYMLILSLGNLLREKELPENNDMILNTFINSALGYGLFLLISLSRFHDTFFSTHVLASVIFLAGAISFWIKEKSKYSTFFYSMLGYTALSVAILSIFKIPDSLMWLCWQSLLVISTALWFRSKIIVVANFIIFLMIFIGFLIMARDIGLSSLSFGIVALLSARIMNWQRNRLELKTELMRNLYLICAFFTIPYALYFNIPRAYLGLSWLGVAIVYYAFSIILNNKKYRWMALLTLLLTVSYILVIGIAQLEAIYRVISFLVIGLVLLITSIIYTRVKGRNETLKTEGEK